MPLFVEELTRVVGRSGDGKLTQEIPVTLHDSLMARLDRLGAAREVAGSRRWLAAMFFRIAPRDPSDSRDPLKHASHSPRRAVLRPTHHSRGGSPIQTCTDPRCCWSVFRQEPARRLHRQVARRLKRDPGAGRDASWTSGPPLEQSRCDRARYHGWERAAKAAEGRDAFEAPDEPPGSARVARPDTGLAPA